tara:strand:- start:3235 stop:4380 length:1146 start_codon:yes stop_codon:yes gene_type:complete
MDVFVDWLVENDVNMANIEIIELNDNERGVKSKFKMKEGDEIMLIPRKLLISSIDVDKTEAGQRINEHFDKETFLLKSIINMSVFLLFSMIGHEKYSTFWDPYFLTLPDTLKHIPLFWTKLELGYLKGSSVLDDIMVKNGIIKKEYLQLKRLLTTDFNIFTLEEYKKIRCLVSSRNFRLTINGKTSTTLVPLADMLNHSLSADTRWTYDNTQQGYQMVLLKDIGSCHEITDSYGRKSNNQYFIHYGFVLDDGITTKITLKIDGLKFELTTNFNSIDSKNVLNKLRKSNPDFDKNTLELNALIEYKTQLLQKKDNYPKSTNYYKKNKNKGSLNKRNAYLLLFKELEIIELNLTKIEIIRKSIVSGNKETEYSDVNDYLNTLS